MTSENAVSDTTRRTVCRALATGAAGLAALPGVAAAQEEKQTPTESPTPEGEQVAVQIDPVTRIEGYEYREGAFEITLSAETPQVVKVTDSGAVMEAWSSGDGGGATTIPTEGYTLSSGKTTIEFSATLFEGAAAVSVATSNGTAFVYSDSIDVANPAVEWSTVQGLLAAGMGGTGYLTFRQTRSRYQDDETSEPERFL